MRFVLCLLVLGILAACGVSATPRQSSEPPDECLPDKPVRARCEGPYGEPRGVPKCIPRYDGGTLHLSCDEGDAGTRVVWP